MRINKIYKFKKVFIKEIRIIMIPILDVMCYFIEKLNEYHKKITKYLESWRDLWKS